MGYLHCYLKRLCCLIKSYNLAVLHVHQHTEESVKGSDFAKMLPLPVTIDWGIKYGIWRLFGSFLLT